MIFTVSCMTHGDSRNVSQALTVQTRAQNCKVNLGSERDSKNGRADSISARSFPTRESGKGKGEVSS